MTKEHIAAGTEVRPGIYRCNACANQYEAEEDPAKLPQCRCGSFSWRTLKAMKDREK